MKKTLLFCLLNLNLCYSQPTSKDIDYNRGNTIETYNIKSFNTSLFPVHSNNYTPDMIPDKYTNYLSTEFQKIRGRGLQFYTGRDTLNNSIIRNIIIFKKDTMIINIKNNILGVNLNFKTFYFTPGSFTIDLKEIAEYYTRGERFIFSLFFGNRNIYISKFPYDERDLGYVVSVNKVYKNDIKISHIGNPRTSRTDNTIKCFYDLSPLTEQTLKIPPLNFINIFTRHLLIYENQSMELVFNSEQVSPFTFIIDRLDFKEGKYLVHLDQCPSIHLDTTTKVIEKLTCDCMEYLNKE